MRSDASEPNRAVPRPYRGWMHGVVLVGYLLLTVVMTWPMAAQITVAIPGDGFDGWQNYWNLWWVKVALVERIQNPYLTDLLYSPTGVSLYFHTLNPFNGLVTLPVQLAAGLIAAYNSVVLISWVLAGYGMWLLARWVILRSATLEMQNDRKGANKAFALLGRRADLAAFVAGAIFVFAPVHMAHLLGHMQVMALQWLPFYVLALLRGMTRARDGKKWLHDAVRAGVFLTLAGLCDWYFVLYLLLFTAIAIRWAGLAVLWQRASWRMRLWGAIFGPPVVVGVLFALLLAPLLIPMVYEAIHYSFMVRPTSDLYTFSATVMDFVIPNRLHTLFRPESFAAWGNQVAPVSERTIAVGYGALALAGVALVTMRRHLAWWGVLWWGAVACVFALLALGPRMHLWQITWEDIPTNVSVAREWSLYALVNRMVPFMRISRSVSRFAIVVQLAIAVLAGVGLAWWMRQLRTHVAMTVGVAMLVLVLAESWVAPFPMSPPDTPAYYETLAHADNVGAVLNLPMNYDRPGYLLYQTVHQRPLTVAYISREDPRTLTERVPLLQHWRHLGPDILVVDPAQVGMTVLQDLGVDTVVLDRYKMPGGEEREYTEALANALFADVAPTYADDRLTVYTVTPPDVPQPYLEMGPLNWGALTDVHGVLGRAVLEDGAAELFLRHVTRGAQVSIDYVSDVDAVVSSEDGSSWPMPAAPDGGKVVVELPLGIEQLTFTAPNGEVRITQLTLSAAQN